MKKILFAAAATALAVSAPAAANQEAFACQYTASSGLKWENGRWESTRFILEAPFFLTTIDNNLTSESVGAHFGTSPSDVACAPRFETRLGATQICASIAGEVINFSYENMRGTVAYTFGGALPADLHEKDTVTVSSFICTKVK